MSTSKIEIENVFYARIPEDKNSIQNVTFEKQNYEKTRLPINTDFRNNFLQL